MTIRNLRSLSLVLLAASALSGCGNQSANPIKDYHLNAIDPKLNNGKTANDQLIIDSPLAIDVNPDAGNPESTVFVEGQMSARKIRVNKLDGDVNSFSLNLLSGPQGMTLVPTADASVYLLKWAAPIGSVSDKLTSSRFHVELQASVVSTADARLKAMPASKAFDVEVIHNQAQPTLSVSGLPNVVTQGDQVKFSIFVNDTSNTPIAPTPIWYAPTNTDNLEQFRASGASFVEPAQGQWIKSLGHNKWQYDLVYNLRGREIALPLDNHGKPNANADELNACVTFSVSNAFGIKSNEHSECLTIKLAAQAPVITFDGPTSATSNDIIIGTTNTIKFSVATPNQKGTVDVANLTSGFANWPGRPKLECTPVAGDLSQASCVITWVAPCTLKEGAKSLNLKATSHFGDRSKTTKLSRTLNLVAQSGACTQPAPTAPATVAPASPSTSALRAAADAKQGAPAIKTAANATTAKTTRVKVKSKSNSSSPQTASLKTAKAATGDVALTDSNTSSKGDAK